MFFFLAISFALFSFSSACLFGDISFLISPLNMPLLYFEGRRARGLDLKQGYYNCLRQGSDLTPKIWSFCTLEFTVHSALFEPVWFVIVLQVSTQHFLFRFSISSLRSISSLHCLQTARNKAECTVNSKVQKDQILGATPYPCRRQL